MFECLDWAVVLRRWDTSESLFCLDPSYFGGETDYGKNMFDHSDFARMSEILSNPKGAFILSINDTPEIREVFAGFYLAEMQFTYSITASGSKRTRELIISNQRCKPLLFKGLEWPRPLRFGSNLTLLVMAVNDSFPRYSAS